MNLYQHIITTQQNLYYGLTFTWLHWVFVAACKLLGVACRIVFWPGIKAGPLHWQHGVFSHWTTRGVPGFTLGVACSMGFDKGIAARIHGYSITQNSFTTIKIMCSTYSFLSPPSSFTMSPQFCRFSVTLYAAFCDWLLSFNNMYLHFLHVFSWFKSPFLLSSK